MARRSDEKTKQYDAAALEALVQRAESAAQALQALESTTDRGEEFAAMQQRIAELQTQLSQAEKAAAELETIRARSAEQAVAVEAIGGQADRITSSISSMAQKIEAVLQLKDQLDNVDEMNAQFALMNKEANSVRTQVRDITENLARLRTVHDDVLRAHKHATHRLDGLDERHPAATNTMDAVERRAQTADEALEALMRLASGIPDAQHQLGVLKATADQVHQKTAALESQREMVERALNQASQVAALNAQVAAAFRGQEDQTRALARLEGKLGEVEALNNTVLSRSAEISAQQKKLDDAEREATRELATLREEMRASTERFEMENRSLDATGERIVELRSFVAECETRVRALDGTVKAVSETESRTNSLASQVTNLTEDVNRISAQAERLRVVRDDVGALDERLRQLAERMGRVEQMRPAVDEVARELTTLNGAQESVRDGLEQVRVAADEMARLRDVHAETSAWLSDADERMRSLRGHVDALER
ncbi:MAG: hypothetical protein ACREOG_01645, partial [Gemmatimonadaceae bacterium]